jgi:hypothetical protein
MGLEGIKINISNTSNEQGWKVHHLHNRLIQTVLMGIGIF